MNNITPKEAIINLNHIYGMVSPDIQRSLDVAIKALERPSGDCISREALKVHISELLLVYSGEELDNAILNAIDNAQAIPLPNEQIAWEQGYEAGLAQGKHDRTQGEWARHDEGVGDEYVGGFYHVNCPCEDGYYSKWRTSFCPNCGLPMMKGGAE